MALNLITGYAGIPHITSENDGAVNAALYGSERYVLNTGQKFAYEIISNNLIRIKDGYAMNQGRKIGLAISEYEDLTIDNGLQGVKRSDIIVIRYTKNLDTGIESADFVVVKGTSGDAYKDPALETGNIIQGDSVDDLPLYRVKIDGLSIAAVEPMFNVLMSMQEMHEELTELNSKLIICEYNISGLSVNANSSATQSITIDTIDGYVPSSVAFERNDDASWHIITSFCIRNNEVIMTAFSNATSTNVLIGKIRVAYTKS